MSQKKCVHEGRCEVCGEECKCVRGRVCEGRCVGKV